MTLSNPVAARWEDPELLAKLHTLLEALRAGETVRTDWLPGSEDVDERRDLRCAPLSNVSLEGVDLAGWNLDSADASGANLCQAKLEGANLMDANLEGANLQGANLRGAIMLDARIAGADLRDADLRHASLAGVDFTDVNIQGADLRFTTKGVAPTTERANNVPENTMQVAIEDLYSSFASYATPSAIQFSPKPFGNHGRGGANLLDAASRTLC